MEPLDMSLEEMLFYTFTPLCEVRQATVVLYEPGLLSSSDDGDQDKYTLEYVDRADLLVPGLNMQKLKERLSTAIHQSLALASSVATPEGSRHLFLMDFSCAARPECLDTSLVAIEECVRALGQKDGILVQTHNAFHFYGRGPLLKEEEWQSLFGEAKKFSIVESGYLNLSTRRGFSALRLIPRSGHTDDVPRVISTIGAVNIPRQMVLFP